MEYYETPHNRDGEDTMRVEGEEGIPLIGSCVEEEEAMDVDGMAKYNCFPSLDKSEGLENTCLVEYSRKEKEDLITSRRLISNYPLSEEHTAILDYSEAIPKSSVFEQEAIIMSPTISPDHGTTETQFNSNYFERLVEDEEKKLCSNERFGRPQAASVEEYTRTETDLEGTSAVFAYPLSVEGVSTIDCMQAQNLVNKDWINEQVSNTYLSDHRSIYNELDGEEIFCNVDDGGKPVSINQDYVGCIGEAALGQTTDFVSTNNIESQKKVPAALYHLERGANEHPIEKATMKLRNLFVCEDNVEVSNNGSILSCIESDVNLRPSFEKMNNDTPSEDNLGNGPYLEYASINEIDGSHPLNMVKIPETCEDTISKEWNSNLIGLLPDDFPEVDETVGCSLKEKGLDAPAEGSNLNYIEDANLKLVLFFETINNNIRTEGHMGNAATMGMDSKNAPIVETDASHPLNISDTPETHLNNSSGERSSSQLGIFPDDLSEMDDKMMDPTNSSAMELAVLIRENTLEVPADENLVPSLEMVNVDTRSEHLGNESDLEYASIVETDGSHPLRIADKPEIHEDHTAKERSSNQIGILPDDLPEVDQSTANFCLEGEDVTVKTENLDSIDNPSPDSANVSFSMYVNAKSCQKLQNKLPPSNVKRKKDSRVVTLRDPSARSWPVLYHESSKFVGFLGGWKEFATANNLQNGDIGQFEVVNASESIFQMRSSKSSK